MTVVYVVIGLLAVFSASLVLVLLAEMIRLRRSSRSTHPPTTSSAHPGGRFERYVGPVDRTQAPLTPATRVLVEFVAAVLGFPGLGWMTGGHFAVGLPLLVVVPAALWMLFPLYVSAAAIVLERPLAGLAVLPAIAVASASMLARAECRDLRRKMMMQR